MKKIEICDTFWIDLAYLLLVDVVSLTILFTIALNNYTFYIFINSRVHFTLLKLIKEKYSPVIKWENCDYYTMLTWKVLSTHTVHSHLVKGKHPLVQNYKHVSNYWWFILYTQRPHCTMCLKTTSRELFDSYGIIIHS